LPGLVFRELRHSVTGRKPFERPPRSL
jgi:hypothetical protein